MTHSPAPTRATASATLVAGILSIPVKLYSAIEDVAVKRVQYNREGLRVGSAACVRNDDGSYGPLVDRRDIVKKFPTESGVLIDLSDDEIESLVVTAKDRIELVSTHPYDIYEDEYVPNGQLWQVRATSVGVQALEVFLQALAEEGLFAVVTWCRSGTPYVGALFSDGRLYGLRYDEEIREEAPRPRVAEVDRNVVRLARQLVSTYSSGTALTLTHPSEHVRAYAEAKAKTSGIVVIQQDVPVNPGLDLLAQLQQSIEAAGVARKAKAKVSA